MVKAVVVAISGFIEDKQVDHLLRTTAAYSTTPERDTAMLLVLYGVGLTAIELSTITIASYIDANGSTLTKSSVPVGSAHNRKERPLYWSSQRVVAALDQHLAWRLAQKHGLGKKKAYRGLDPDSPIFLKVNGRPYVLVEKILPSGASSYSCNALSSYISRLHSRAGLGGSSAQDARRTWAIKQYRRGIDVAHIAMLLGHRSLTSTRKLLEGEEVAFADIVASVI